MEESCRILGDSEAVFLEDRLDEDVKALILEDSVDLADVLFLHYDH